MRALVLSKAKLATDVVAFELGVPADDYVEAGPGSHIAVRLGDSPARSYSLTREALPGVNRYEIAVRRGESPASLSGQLCDQVMPGSYLEVAAPRNLFQVDEDAKHHVLIGGGIGVTPLMAMARCFLRTGKSFELHIAFSTPDNAVFMDELRSGGLRARTTIYFSRSEKPNPLVLTSVIQSIDLASTVYACGPARLLDEVRVLCDARGLSHRFESFEPAFVASGLEGTFEVFLQRSGRRFAASNTRSLLDQIQEQGIQVDSSCRSGTCGTCVTRVVSGDLIHRDSCLYPEEQARGDQMALCVSTASTGSVLVLDL